MYRNIEEALVKSLGVLLEKGDVVPSRNGETRELWSHHMVIENPLERVLLAPGRGHNPFAALAETMWVLAGRNDMEFLSRYLPRAKDFSDDGKTWRGGYGPRLRAWERFGGIQNHLAVYPDIGSGLEEACTRLNLETPYSLTNPDPVCLVDQIEECVKILTENPDSRRAVMVIFDPSQDYTQSKDIPCLAGETILWSPEGDLPISEVARRFENGEVTRWPVYSVDPGTNSLSLQWATRVWKSGEKETLRLNFDDGSSIRATPDHRFFQRKRVRKEGKNPRATFNEIKECVAGDLEPGDRIWATRRFYNPKRYELHKKYLDKGTAWSNLQPTAREYVELLRGSIPDGHDVHHVNEIKTDNRAENLEIHPHGLHSSFNMFGDDNPMRRLGEEKHRVRAKKQSVSLRANHASRSPEERSGTREKQRQAALRRSGHPDTGGNHKILSVESGGVTPVYDFHVPSGHTAIVGTGVVAHNCNNWVAFKIRNGKLNMTIGVRSNDVIWGFSGINVFEWSVLQQMMAHWTGVEVGQMGYLADSFHLYDHHYEKAQKILAQAKAKTLYDFGFKTPAFSTCWEDFPALTEGFFSLENLLRNGSYDAFDLELKGVKDEFLRTTLLMLKAYNTYLERDTFQQSDTEYEPMAYLRPIARQVNEIPQSDLRVAAIDFFRRQKGFGEKFMALVELSAQERAFFDYITSPPKTEISFTEVFDTLKVLHEKKSRSYGDSWKKHGEVLGVFSNITRKRDRLVNLLAGSKATTDEGLFDTYADLCVYAGKYLTLLAELYPTQFLNKFLRTRDVVLDGEVDGFQGNSGFDSVVDELLRSKWVDEEFLYQGSMRTIRSLSSLLDCMTVLESLYSSMERTLLDPNRKENGSTVLVSAKMCLVCAQALRLLSLENSGLWDSYVASVERL